MRVRKSPPYELFIGAPLYVCVQDRSNLPLSVIDEECLDLANLDISSDQREAKSFSSATHIPPAADEPVGDASPPQSSTAATPLARNRDIHVPEGTSLLVNS